MRTPRNGSAGPVGTPTHTPKMAASPAPTEASAPRRPSGSAAGDAMDASVRGSNAARTRSAVNGQMKGAMSGIKKAGIIALSAAVLAGGAFVGYQQMTGSQVPDPTPVVVPVEAPDSPGLPGVIDTPAGVDGATLPSSGKVDTAPASETSSGLPSPNTALPSGETTEVPSGNTKIPSAEQPLSPGVTETLPTTPQIQLRPTEIPQRLEIPQIESPASDSAAVQTVSEAPFTFKPYQRPTTLDGNK